MSELKLGRRHETEYGARYDGKVVDGKHSIDITYREPHDTSSDTLYINANGLSAGKATMRLGAQIGAHVGHKTVTVNYSNRSLRNCLDANAGDIAAVADAFSDDHRKRLIGLSEGGLVATRAMLLTRIHAATLVNPAGLIENHSLSWLHGSRRISSVVPECIGYFRKDPLDTIRLGASCVINCVQRPLGVFGEMNELRAGNEHANLIMIKQQPDPPHIRICSSDRDSLLKRVLIESGAERLPIDDSLVFPGGHCDWASDPVLAQTVYSRDRQLFSDPSESLPLAA